MKSVYFTTIYRCDQDVIDTLCVAEHVLKEIQKDHPNIKQLFRKTDNAGCYSGNSVAEIEYSICRQNGFTLLRHDYNEPHKGKDQADRESAVAKKYMNGYLNSGHDIITAEDIKKGILYLGGLADTKVSVIEINKNDCYILHSKIPHTQSFHPIAFTYEAMTSWQYYNIGIGKALPFSGIEFESGVNVLEEFQSSKEDRPGAESQGRTERHKRSLCSLKFCPIMGCTASFESEAELPRHNLSGSHQTVEIRSSMDEVKSYYAELIHASSNLHHDVSTGTVRSCSTSEIVSNCKLLAHFRKPGWALPKRKHTKFSHKQRKFAYDEFMAGELSGRKTSPEKVIGKMRSAKDKDGNKLFIPAEYFTREQVISIFSRMASKKRSGEFTEPIQLQEDNLEPLEEQDVDDEGDSELFEDENEAMVEELLNDVKNFDELKSGSFVYAGLMDKACSNSLKANTKLYIGQILSAKEEEFRITYLR